MAHDIDSLTSNFQTQQQERDLRLNSEIAKLESEMRNRFEKNESLAESKNNTSLEGRRWLIGTVATLVLVLGAMINWWGSSIKESTLGEVNNSLNIIREQNAVSIKDRDDMRRAAEMVTRDVNTNTAQLSTLRAQIETQLMEVETQFRASDRARNVQFAEQQRMNADLQNQVAGLGGKVQISPPGPYYFPEITHDGTTVIGK